MTHAHGKPVEFAFVDPGVSDLDVLLAGLRPDVEAIVLGAGESAPRQMAGVLEGRSGLRAVHVISHGQSGEVSFTAGALTAESLARHADDLPRAVSELEQALVMSKGRADLDSFLDILQSLAFVTSMAGVH